MHYNWHRHYDPSIGRYTQPDPLGFVDGPSVYAYARNAPGEAVDPDGRNTAGIGIRTGASIGGAACGPACAAAGAVIGGAVGLGIMCMATRPRGFWPGDKGAEEWGRRNGHGSDEGRRRFHEIKQQDNISRGDDDYSVNPGTGDVADTEGEIIGNLAD